MGDLWRALGYLRPYWYTTLAAFVSLLLVTLTSLFIPQILQLVVDHGISTGNLSAILSFSLLLLVVAIIRDLFTFSQGYWTEKASQGAAYDLRNAIFARLENLSFSYHDKAHTGQLLTRVTSDVDMVRNFTGAGILKLLNANILLLGCAIILLLTNWRLALITLAMVPTLLGMFLFFLRRIGSRFKLVQQKLGNLNSILQENLAGVRVIKAFVREPYERTRYRQSNNDLLQENLVIVRGSSFTFSLIFFIANLATLAVIWFGGAQVIGGTLSVGALLAFNTYLSFLLQQVFILGITLTTFAQSAASARRVFEVIDAPIEVTDGPDAIELPPLHGHVVFEDVVFRYAGSDMPTLTGISLVAKPGQTIAILGRTGSGKSTLVNLIPRFYEVTNGRVMVDGNDVRGVKLESLRTQIGFVLQEAALFSGTIRDNIAYGRPLATDAEVEAAARAAQAHTFITSFPEGYATLVGERGVGLSGGQRQRIAIARALLLNPALLILDDSTSAVDAETEFQIQQALRQLLVNRTAFVIAERVSTVRNADWIVLLDERTLVAQGTHDELLKSSGLYSELLASHLLNDEERVSVT